jgi:hypothetical protein
MARPKRIKTQDIVSGCSSIPVYEAVYRQRLGSDDTVKIEGVR